MDQKGPNRLFQEYENISLGTIPESDHQVVFNNPESVCSFIIKNEKEQETMISTKHQEYS